MNSKKLITLAFLFLSINAISQDSLKVYNDSINIIDSCIPTYKLLFNKIKELNIEFPEIVFAQSVLESGHFKSPLSISNNNIFGMRMPRIRKTTALLSINGYAFYTSWILSVQDYKLYQESLFIKRKYSKGEYLKLLNKKYSEKGSIYTKSLLSIISRIKNLVK